MSPRRPGTMHEWPLVRRYGGESASPSGKAPDPLLPAAAVMGTGIVSVALSLDGHETLSRALLGLAAAGWILLAAQLAGRALRGRAPMRREAATSGSPASV